MFARGSIHAVRVGPHTENTDMQYEIESQPKCYLERKDVAIEPVQSPVDVSGGAEEQVAYHPQARSLAPVVEGCQLPMTASGAWPAGWSSYASTQSSHSRRLPNGRGMTVKTANASSMAGRTWALTTRTE